MLEISISLWFSLFQLLEFLFKKWSRDSVQFTKKRVFCRGSSSINWSSHLPRIFSFLSFPATGVFRALGHWRFFWKWSCCFWPRARSFLRFYFWCWFSSFSEFFYFLCYWSASFCLWSVWTFVRIVEGVLLLYLHILIQIVI